MIVDDRFNNGGSQPADYFIDYLQRRLWNFVSSREGGPRTVPTSGLFGPKVMIVNEYSSSGGDALAYYFRQSASGADWQTNLGRADRRPSRSRADRWREVTA